MRHAAAFALIWLAAAAPAREITPQGLDNLPAADVVVLGEVHDNPAHHLNQARAVEAIRPAALVFEMLTPEQAARAADVPRDDAAALAQALEWEGSGWPDFAMYHPIFLAAPEAAIRGGALPRDQVRRAMTDDPAAVFGADAARYGLDQPLPAEEQVERAREQAAAHCDALPPDMAGGMVHAQRLRDAALARAAEQAHRDTGAPVVVITGTGHARLDQGMPVPLARAAPDLTILSIGQLEVPPATPPPYDLWIVTPHDGTRGDPCAAFRSTAGE